MSDEAASCSRTSTSPASRTIDVYERLGGYTRAAQGADRDGARGGARTSSRSSGLRGRGGAGFSMGKKASFIPKGTMDKYLCCNADESEPGTFKDRLLMQKNPHLLIEGIMIAPIAAGANTGVHLHPRRVRAAGRRSSTQAVAEAYAKGYVGERILGSDSHFELVVHRGAGRLHLRRGDRRCSTRSRASAATRG